MSRQSAANRMAHPMIPVFALRLILRLFLLLASILILIHSQPFDNGGLQALLLWSSDCSVPCFMGIRPGKTTAAQASDLLEKQGFVSSWLEPVTPETQPTDASGFGLLRWRWSHLRPAMLTGIDASLLYDKKTGLVVTFGGMNTRIPLATLFIELGQPMMGFMSGGINDRDRPTFTHVAGYPDWHFDALSYIQCPMTIQQLWESPVTLEIANTIGENSRFTMYPTRLQPLLAAAASYFCE